MARANPKYEVWVHPKGYKDDQRYVFRTKKGAEAFRSRAKKNKRYAHVERVSRHRV